MIYQNTVRAIFLNRLNRFVAECMVDGKVVACHVPNTSRLTELFIEGAEVNLTASNNPNRKTAFTLIQVKKNGFWINIDSQSPNIIVSEAIQRNPSIIGLTKNEILSIKREVTFEYSRFDIGIETINKKYFIEVKGVTLEDDGIARFPGAPTTRGRKHLIELVQAKNEGYGAAIFFCVQIPYAQRVNIYRDMDAAFGEAYDYAKAQGVKVFAYNCDVQENSVELNQLIAHE